MLTHLVIAYMYYVANHQLELQNVVCVASKNFSWLVKLINVVAIILYVIKPPCSRAHNLYIIFLSHKLQLPFTEQSTKFIFLVHNR